MKRVKISFLFVIMISFFLNLTITNAATCDNKKLEELKQKADNIEIHTEFDEESINIGIYNNYILTISGLTNEFYIITNNQEKIYDIDEQIEGVITDKINTNTKKITIYAYECGETEIKSVEVKLKKFNEYSLKEECKNLKEELDVCNKFYDGELTYSSFMNEIEKYDKDLNKKFNTNGWLKKNLLYIGIGVIIILVIMVIIIKNKKNKLD